MCYFGEKGNKLQILPKMTYNAYNWKFSAKKIKKLLFLYNTKMTLLDKLKFVNIIKIPILNFFDKDVRNNRDGTKVQVTADNNLKKIRNT